MKHKLNKTVKDIKGSFIAGRYFVQKRNISKAYIYFYTWYMIFITYVKLLDIDVNPLVIEHAISESTTKTFYAGNKLTCV